MRDTNVTGVSSASGDSVNGDGANGARGDRYVLVCSDWRGGVCFGGCSVSSKG